MKTFTTYAEKKAKQILNLLQGYTKGIRITAILILLLMGVGNAWAEPWLCRSTAGGKIATKTVGDKLNDGNEWNYTYTTNGGWSAATDIQVYIGTSTTSYTAVNAVWKSDDGNTNKNVAANIGSVSFDKSGKWYAVGKYKADGKTAYTTKKDEWTNNTTLSMGSNNEPYWEVTPPAVSNFTVSVSGYLSGTGTSNDPYIVQYGKALTVNLSGSQAKTDANSTLQYNTSGTWNTTTSRTISNITSATKTSVTVKMRCHNSTASLSGTESSKTIYYRAEDVHTVTINNDGHGTTTPSGAQSNVGQVTGLSIKATPAANYEFVNWTITSGSGSFGSTTSASTTFKPTSAATIQANFRSTATYSLTVIAGNGISQVAGSKDPVTLGSTYAITATPETGYTFSTWTANPVANATFGNATTANTTVTVKNGSVTVTASATENLYAITVQSSNNSHGTVTKSADKAGITTSITITATPESGYRFVNWTTATDGITIANATDASTTVTATAAGTITANFEEIPLETIYFVNKDNWSKVNVHLWDGDEDDTTWPGIEATKADFQLHCCDVYYVSALPGSYKKCIFSNNGNNQTADLDWTAGKYYYNGAWKTLDELTYKVKLAGSMLVNNGNWVLQDMTVDANSTNSITVSLNANTTYEFKIVVDEAWHGNTGTMTYGNSTGWTMSSSEDTNCKIKTAGAGNYIFTYDVCTAKLTVTYPTSYTVTYSRTPTAAADAPTTDLSITSGNYVAADTRVTFTAKTANTGYTFKGWYDNNTGTGDALSTNLAYTRTINANTTIYAVYTVNTYNINIVANPTEAAESLTTSPQAVGAEKVNISTTAKFTYKFDNWTATDGITITDASNPSTSITATKAGTVTANFIQLQPTTVYLKPGDNWNQDNARFAIHYWHDGQPTGWVDMTEIDCNRDYFVGTIPAGYTEFMFVRMNPANPENKWDANIDWNKTGNLTIPTDGKNLFTLPTSGDNIWNGATTTWSTYTEPTHDITINAPESGTITVTIDGNTTTVTNEATTIEDVALNAQMTVAFTPATGYKLGKAIIEIGNNDDANAAGTYTVCGPTEITAYFVTEEDQVVYLRPTDAWLANNARFAAYAFNRYAGTEAAQWIELTTKDTDYTGVFSATIPAGFSHVQFVRMPETGDFSFDIDLAHTINFSIPVDNNNRFLIGDAIASGSDAGKYQGRWEANDTPIYGIPGYWQGNEHWSADAYPLMGPNGEVTVNITQTNTTLGFKVYSYPYATTDDDQWLGNNSTMVRGGDAVHEGGWTMETSKNNCGLYVDIAGNYIFHFNIRNKKLTVTYPELPVPEAITVTSRRLYDNTELDWFEGNGTEANPYKLYNDETIRLTVSPLTEVAGLTAYYKLGDNEEQTSNVFDWEETMSEPTKTTIQAYYKNATGTSTETVSVETPYYIQISLPFYLMTEPSGEINIDRVAAGENILVQFRSDAAATVGLYVKIGNGEEQKLTDITSTISTDYTHDVDDNIAPCVLHYIARSTATVHDRIFEATTDVAIYKNVIIKVNDPEGWVKNAYMWRDYSDAVLTQWPGDPVLQNFGTWRVFSVKYPYYDRFIVNDGKAEGATQTIDYVLPADDTCYELLAPANNGSPDPADAGKYGLQIADCPKNLIVEDIEDVTLMEGEQIVVMPKIYVGLGYQLSDVSITQLNALNPSSVRADISGTNIVILGYAEGESNVNVTYNLNGTEVQKTFKVTVEKNTNITIQVKVPDFGDGSEYQWTDGSKYGIRYWGAGIDGTDLIMDYAYTDGTYMYAQAQIPLGTDGIINFHFYYEKYGDDNAKWRQTTNISATNSGCYTLKQGNDYYRHSERTADYCFNDENYAQYQVKVFMPTLGKVYSSNIVTNTTDILSFFAPGENETGYRAGNVQLYKNKKMIASIPANNFPESNVYTATIAETGDGLDNVSTYSGNFYIRTWGTDGDINNMGWHSVKEWNDTQKKSRTFTEFVSREGEFYNHYWVQAMNTGTFDGKDVSACVANEYNDDLVGKLLQDKHTNEYGDIKVGTGKVINVRFGYDPRTNYFGRAILQGSEYDTYLNIHCDNAYYDKDCTKKFPYGTSNRDNKMYDISTWVYQRDFYVPITNTAPSATLYVEATSPNTTKDVTDHLLGYVINEITGEATSTPIQKTVIGSGTTNGTYLIRVIYDFKTNRIITAWLPQGTVEVNSEKTLNADVLFVREENNEVPQIQLSNQGKIKSLESMFFAMELQRIDENKDNRHEEQYWFTLPFDCVVGSISGVPGYMNIWGIQRYRGDLRAQKGWFIDTPTFWEWLTPQDTLKAGEGYLLAFDKKNAPFEEIEVDKMDAEGNLIEGEKETISMMRLYFPSIKSGFDMQQQSAEQLRVTYPNHTCTITYKDRDKQDSNWKVIGTTSYNNAGVTSYTKDTDPGYEEWEEGAPKFRYEYSYTFDENNVRTSYTYTPELGAGEGVTYKSFFSYMVQFAGTITWQPIMSETVPEQIAARRYVPANERTSFTTRLEIANADGKKQDQTFVALDEKATTTFDQNLDLNKVMNSHKANIYTLSEGIPFAGNTLPVEKVTVPVGVRTETAGEYTFRMPDGTDGITVTLVDNATGTHTNMLMDEYTVTLDAGTIENRFYLVVDPDRTATSVENIGEEAKGEEAKGQIKKFLIDGKLIIRTADGIFDAKGQRL